MLKAISNRDPSMLMRLYIFSVVRLKESFRAKNEALRFRIIKNKRWYMGRIRVRLGFLWCQKSPKAIMFMIKKRKAIRSTIT